MTAARTTTGLRLHDEKALDWRCAGPGPCERAKSTCATEAAKAINGDFNVTALQNRVSPETEDVFNDKYWQGLDVVVNALDNVNARLYVDSRCVYFGVPLLAWGRRGRRAHHPNTS